MSGVDPHHAWATAIRELRPGTVANGAPQAAKWRPTAPFLNCS